MFIRLPSLRRRGATVVECAIVYPVLFLFLLGLAVGGAGIFRYQEVASLAREAARYASTHGANYRSDAGLPVGTASDWSADVYNNSISPNMVALDPNSLSYSVTWPPVINLPASSDNWPGSQVTVTVTYLWFPEVYLVGPITLSSTSSMPITN
jgi:Flp pilus assembly protein TadG